MSKLIDKNRLARLAQLLDARAKERDESIQTELNNVKNIINEIDYDSTLAFNTNEIVIENLSATSSVLDIGQLDTMVLDGTGSNEEVTTFALTSEFSKQNFIPYQLLKAEHLNYIEDGIMDLLARIKELESGVCLSVLPGEGDEEGGDDNEEVVVTLSSISAIYTGGNVAVGTAVNSLSGITVTAHYSDGSTQIVTGYTLSGTIAEGSNTITVSYQSKTTTFNVTGFVSTVYYTLTINPSPSDATVKINGTEQKEVTVLEGTVVTYEVSKDGYRSQSGSKTVNATETLNITLEEIVYYTLTINPTPSNAVVKINNVEQKSITVEAGTNITYEVTADGYKSNNGSKVVNATETIDVVLEEIVYYTLTINADPSDATILINGVEQNSITVEAGTTITYSVSKAGYTAQNGTKTVNATETLSIVLEEIQAGTEVVLANESDFTAGTWLRPTGVVADGAGYATTDYIDVSAYESVTITAILKTASLSPVVWYDSSKTYISGETGTGSAEVASHTFDVPSGAVYARFSCYYDPNNMDVTAKIKDTSSYTLTIATTPSDAIVKINGVVQNSITVVAGTTIEWEVSKEGYLTQNGSKTVNITETIGIVLSQDMGEPVFTVLATEADCSSGYIKPGGTEASGASYGRTDYIDVTGYDTITLNVKLGAASVSPAVWYDADKNHISSIDYRYDYDNGLGSNLATNTQLDLYYAVPENAVYFRCSGYIANSTPMTVTGGKNSKVAVTMNYTDQTNAIVDTTIINTVYGRVMNFNESNAKAFGGYTFNSVTPTGDVTLSEDLTVTYNYTCSVETTAGMTVIVSPSDYTNVGYYNSSGVMSSGSGYYYTDYIDISAYSSVTVLAQTKAGSVSPVGWYDANKTFISGTTTGGTQTQFKTYTFEAPEGAVYAIFSAYTNEYAPTVRV